MADTITVARPQDDERTTLNRGTGKITQAADAGPVYTGKAHVGARGESRDDDSGKIEHESRHHVMIPWGTPEANLPLPGDHLTVVTSRDAILVGRTFRVVTRAQASDLSVSRSFDVVDMADEVNRTRVP